MIKIDEKGCEVRGQGIELLAELGMIVKQMYEVGLPDELIEAAIEAGKLNAEKKLDLN